MERKTINLALGIFAAAFAVFSILVFVIAGFGGHTAGFWVSYFMTLIVFAVSATAVSLNFKHGKRFEKLFYGYPIMKWSIIYTCASVAVAVICMLIPPLTWVVPFVVIFILTLAYLAIAAGAFVGKEEAIRIDAETKKTVQNMRLLRVEIDSARNDAKDENVAHRLSELSELARYSDPVSADALLPLEDMIKDNIAEIRTAVIANESEKALALIDQTYKMIEERNAKTKAMKQ